MTAIGFIVTGLIKSSTLNKGNPIRFNILLHYLHYLLFLILSLLFLFLISNRLTNEIDYDGRICGYDHGVKDRPNGYYLSTGAVVCVKNCPSKTDYYNFVCFDKDQATADASYVDGWNLVAKGRCMYDIKTNECKFHFTIIKITII